MKFTLYDANLKKNPQTYPTFSPKNFRYKPESDSKLCLKKSKTTAKTCSGSCETGKAPEHTRDPFSSDIFSRLNLKTDFIHCEDIISK